MKGKFSHLHFPDLNFQWSHGDIDWQGNFFPSREHSLMGIAF